MREILFKAKRLDNGEWVEGYYVYCRKRHYILPALNKAIGFDEREDEWVEANPNTLCQYTGLTDKNGQKIWENDICEMVYDGTIYIYMLLFGIKQNLILKEQMEKKTMDVILSISDAVKKLL